MKELIKIIRDVELASHSVIATLLDTDAETKTLFSGKEIVECGGELKFMKENMDAILGVHRTGVYEFDSREVYCEVLEPVPELIVCGAGHVGLACIKAAKLIEMKVTCLEDREDFAELAKAAGADKVICRNVVEAIDDLEGGHDVYILSMMRAHALDQMNLEKLLKLDSAYIGMLGNPKKLNAIKANLEAKGFDLSLFDKLYTPIGLDISAQTPEEIAIAVIGQIIQVKNQDVKHSKAFNDEQIDLMINGNEQVVLATLVRKYDASPREPGTKMIITASGAKCGTIGGGLAEAETMKIASELLNGEFTGAAVHKVGEESITENGMVCGGVIDVLFERVK